MVAVHESPASSDSDVALRLRRAYHEVKSPTALIITVARAALEQNDLARAHSALELIERVAQRSLARTATVLEVATGQTERTPSGFLQALVSDANRCDSNVELTVEDGARFARIRRSPAAFEALAQGLLENAQLHGDTTRPIELRLAMAGSELEFTVTNQCPEVDSYQGQQIGLHLAEDLAERMGGTLTVRSSAGGFVVRVAVPAIAFEG